MKKLSIYSFIIVVFLVCGLFSNATATTILFSEDFESYAQGSNLSGQGGSVGGGYAGTYPILVGYGSGLGSMDANGRLNTGYSVDAYTRNLFSQPLGLDMTYVLSFDAYVYSSSPTSHGSGIGFQQGDYQSGTYWNMVSTSSGWDFDGRYLSGADPSDYTNTENISGPYDQKVSMSIVLDTTNMIFYGLADFGSSGVTMTKQYNIDPTRLSGLTGILLSQDTRGGSGGGEFDNILLTAKPIPEPTTILLIGTGLIIVIGYRRKKSKKLS